MKSGKAQFVFDIIFCLLYYVLEEKCLPCMWLGCGRNDTGMPVQNAERLI